ncbi:right-handed parallel beta-helix repeat-containing protein [Sinorhizobium medicae]|nr:right-handed parallel beta-helix repeat-containing protein [Sinorhizobium medicae]
MRQLVLLSFLGLVAAAVPLSFSGWSATKDIPERKRPAKCDPSTVIATIEENVSSPIYLSCSVTLPKKTTIYRRIIFEGPHASGALLDCNGSTIDTSHGAGTLDRIAIEVRSAIRQDGTWDAPEGVTIKNCTVRGFIRIRGLDYTASGPNMRLSSLNRDHTTFAQSAAPKHTVLANLSITTPGNIALYIGPGVTGTTLKDSTISGRSRSTAIYIDAESRGNIISNNDIDVVTRSREQIAIDGSSFNRIVGNTFRDSSSGGVFIYRNCGEQGVIRHQKPEYNLISGNLFSFKDRPPLRPIVWLGSRGGTQSYCFSDPQHPFGSSASPLDYAQFNTVQMNVVVGSTLSLIRDDGVGNVIENNRQE